MPRNYHRARADILEAMPGDVPHLVKRSGYSVATVKRWLAQLRTGGPLERAAHIGRWIIPEGRGPASAVWHAGPGEHAPKPTWRTDNAEKHRRYKAKHGAKRLNALAALRYRLRKLRDAPPDPLRAALLPKPCENETT